MNVAAIASNPSANYLTQSDQSICLVYGTRINRFRQIITILVFIAILSQIAFAQEGQKSIFAGSVLDVDKGDLVHNVVIHIKDDRIIKMEINPSQEELSNVIDLSDYTVLPGLMDCHTHLTGNWYEKAFDPYTLHIASYGIIGVNNAQRTINAGFTTVRDLHAYFYADIALRDAIAAGWVVGPRMYVSGSGLSITGGHGAWANWLTPQYSLKAFDGVADGTVEVMKKTRELLKYKVDWIKIFASGGFSSYGTIPGASSYSIDEMKAAVAEARKLGIATAAHAHGAEGIKNALHAGVRSIEHGTFIDDEGIALLKQKDAFLVMDLLAAYFDLFDLKNNYEDRQLSSSNQEIYEGLEKKFYEAYSKGIKIVFGTDAGVYPHGRNAEQFALMVKAGMKEIDAIRSATVTSAQLLGVEKDLGKIEKGMIADLIAVKGNPLENIQTLEKVEFVMKSGKIIKNIDSH